MEKEKQAMKEQQAQAPPPASRPEFSADFSVDSVQTMPLGSGVTYTGSFRDLPANLLRVQGIWIPVVEAMIQERDGESRDRQPEQPASRRPSPVSRLPSPEAPPRPPASPITPRSQTQRPAASTTPSSAPGQARDGASSRTQGWTAINLPTRSQGRGGGHGHGSSGP